MLPRVSFLPGATELPGSKANFAKSLKGVIKFLSGSAGLLCNI